MIKEWHFSEQTPPEILEKFPEFRSLVLQLLHNRGINSSVAVESFLDPDYHKLYDPYLFSQMQSAVDRIWEAIEKREKILVYSDYDADAVTANAVLQQTFRYLNYPIASYVPDRFTEGYGLNLSAFEKIKEQGIDLVITVDCGTNSVQEAEFCRENNIDLIITDHHEITGETPNAFALINPKNPKEVYPDSQITGVGVAYKLAKALLMQPQKVIAQKAISPEEYQPEWDKWLLDLVAIGTVADCHSLLGENRILVKFGLKVLQKTKWLGLRQLLENAGVDLKTKEPDSQTLGFVIAPRINSAGRLEHADIAVNLLIATDFAEAISLANRIEEINRRRRDLTNRIVSEAKEQAEVIQDRPVLLLYSDGWAKGLVGIVAGRIAEIYNKPTIILEKGEQESTGSARTGSSGFDIVECLKSVQDKLIKFGGHKQAAGLTVVTSHLDELYAGIIQYANQNPASQTTPVIEIDSTLTGSELSLSTYEDIAQLEPYGMGNPRPVFALLNVEVMSTRIVGATQQHLQLKVKVDGVLLDCIGFNLGYWTNKILVGDKISVAGELQVDIWQGTKKLKLHLVDIHVVEKPDMPEIPETDNQLENFATDASADNNLKDKEIILNQEQIKEDATKEISHN